MKYDFELTNKCNQDIAFLRLYKWNPYCISLGANQKIEDINVIKSQNDGIDIVKRPTGGRAILHAEEITYSVVLTLTKVLTPKVIYEKVSRALIKGLINYNPIFKELELENRIPNFRLLLKEPTGALCFGSIAKNEVGFRGKKIIGSAQRKLNNIILQHGSILCGSYHRKLADYINSEEPQKPLIETLLENTTEIESITKKNIDYESLVNSIIYGFRDEWHIDFENIIVKNSF